MKKLHIKRILFISIVLALAALLVGCFDDYIDENSSDETWAIYWYLCGSDLETDGGAATADLYELLEVSLPENIKVVIQAGGAAQWQNDEIASDKLTRCLYSDEDFEILEELPDANMGETETLKDFLSFCSQNYPADHQMVLFWNHGGGSVTGAAFDENHDFDSLTLSEMHDAFEQVFTLSDKKPPIELIGFDTCLMATVDTASTFSDISKYLVASEELEPGCGWYYSGWMQDLADNPEMNGAELGKVICDRYIEGCEYEGVAEEITLSVTDLQKISPLLDAYSKLGDEALTLACEDPTFFAEFGRAASRSENYGGNTSEEGYTNMVDLGHLVRNSIELLPENSQSILDALEQCVIYKVSGEYREEATGLSCYYSYNGDVEDLNGYISVGSNDAFKHLYTYEITGTLDEEGMDYVTDIGCDDVSDIPDAQSFDLEDFPLTIDDDGNAVLSLGSEIADILKGVYINLCYVSEDDDLILVLGRDNDLNGDWETGKFWDNFRGVWGAIDGNLCYMELIYEGDDYNLYSVPVLLNGEECNLHVAYDYNTEEYKILGARKGLDDTGMADKNLTLLKPGDEISTIHYAMTISGDDDDPTPVVADTFTVTKDTAFTEEDLGDGTFMMAFEMVDTSNKSYLSDIAVFTIENGNIYIEQ